MDNGFEVIATNRVSDYVKINRLLRWLTVIVAAITFPPHHPDAVLIYSLLLLTSLYNLSLYIPAVFRARLWTSPLTTLLINNILAGGFLCVAGGFLTPYALLLPLLITSAAYWYGLKAGLFVIAFQAGLLASCVLVGVYEPMTLTSWRAVLMGVTCLAGLGLLIDRLTRGAHDERQSLTRLSDGMKIERERLTVLLNTLPEAALVTDENARILFYNAGALALLNTHEDLHDQDLAQLLVLKDTLGQPTSLVQLIKDKTHVQRADLSLHVASQPVILLDCNIASVHVRSGRKLATNYVVICRDITKEKTVEQQREEFIAVASHELRTPLTIIEAALSVVNSTTPQLEPATANMIGKAYRNVLFLSELVTDLTTLSEAQNDAIPIKLKPVDPLNLLNQLASDYRHAVEEKSLKLDVRLPTAPIAPILTTEHHVHEILQNFLTNAIKYTNQGQIIIEAKSGHDGTVTFSVQDNGIGISPSDQQKLFSKFYRSEDYRTRETGGTGLGLYLCAQLAKRLNGRVWCESTLDQGSTFYLEIPPLSQLKRDRSQVVEAGTAALVAEL